MCSSYLLRNTRLKSGQIKVTPCRITGSRNEVDEQELEHQKAEKNAVNAYHLENQKDDTAGTIVCSMDLQNLGTPHDKPMLIGFSRKYAVYNETVYESQGNRGICYAGLLPHVT